jgi:L-2-hydroxycarboxylate dehydrogenase (NAD+)
MKIKKLKPLLIKIFKKHGLNIKHSKISTNALINAELVGAYGHGLSRLKMYCDRISKKVINPKPKIKIKKFLNQFLILMQIIVLVLLQQILALKSN